MAERKYLNNPAINNERLSEHFAGYNQATMSIQGTLNRLGFLSVILMTGFMISWNHLASGGNPTGLVMLGAIVGFIIAMITIFNPRISPFTAPVYAFMEGLALGGVSAFTEQQYAGIALQAALVMVCCVVAVFLLYKLHIIRATQKFRMFIISALGAILLLYIADMLLSIFGIRMDILHSNSYLSIGVSMLIVGIASISLILDFQDIEDASHSNLASYMNWYLAFGVLVGLIWLYMEILRLLVKLRD